MMYPHSSLVASSDIIDQLCEGTTDKFRKKVIEKILAHERQWFSALAEVYFPDWIIHAARDGTQLTNIYKEAERWVEDNGFGILRAGPTSYLMWNTGGAMVCLGSIWVEKVNNRIDIHSS